MILIRLINQAIKAHVPLLPDLINVVQDYAAATAVNCGLNYKGEVISKGLFCLYIDLGIIKQDPLTGDWSNKGKACTMSPVPFLAIFNNPRRIQRQVLYEANLNLRYFSEELGNRSYFAKQSEEYVSLDWYPVLILDHT